MTVCAILQIALACRLRPFKTNVSDALITVWTTVCVISASPLGLSANESGLIALPFGWFSARMVQFVCRRKGLQSTTLNEKKGLATQVGSIALFLVVYFQALGMVFNVVAILLLWKARALVWRWMRVQPVDEDTK
jgi:hypothetical protein